MWIIRSRHLGTSYLLLFLAQELEGIAVCFVFHKTALHPVQSKPAAKLPLALQGVGLGSGWAAGGEKQNTALPN